MSNFDELVSKEAYLIWQSEGCPSGQHDRHWAMAVERVQARAKAARAPVIPLSIKRVVLSARPKRKPGQPGWTLASAS
ncbi:DUF2934 domain-containing protein [Rhizobium sp. RU36D]|uniref:DUF2934 domain-containing protein n=1 Tax=Rhizobium sp. RU36D TaxID=1907415 RepID=UPI0009D7A8D3|nr:DUF2934 domain-containing protein [Rhizobium sp. RU36D]SMC73260.1 Protein of unknown function [Rhizobium sp. RU36D]